MNQKYMLGLMSACLLSVGIAHGMDYELSVEERFAQAVHSGDLPEVRRIGLQSSAENIDPQNAIVNKVFTFLIAGFEKRVQVTPLVYAVLNQSKELLSTLLKLGALPIGKLHKAEALSTPMQEAVKLQDMEMILELKNAWLSQSMKENERWSEEILKSHLAGLEKMAKEDGWLETEVKQPDMGASHDFKVAIVTGSPEKVEEQYKRFLSVDLMTLLVPFNRPGKIVNVSPVLFAVLTQNIPLLKLFFSYGLPPCGKFDRAQEFGSPLEEANKSGNPELIKAIKEHAFIWLKAQIEAKVGFNEIAIKSKPEDIEQRIHKITEEELAIRQSQIPTDKDLLLFLEYCSEQERDQLLTVQDKLMSHQNLMQKLSGLSGKVMAYSDKIAKQVVGNM